MTEFIRNLLVHIEDLSPVLIFLFFFLSGFLQIVFPPYPGDTVLVFGGCLGGLAQGGLGTLAFFGYFSATLLSSLALYEAGYRLNERIFSIPFLANILPLNKRELVETRYKRFGVGLLALCKFIPGVNTLVILLGGVMRYPRKLGLSAVAISSLAHNVIFFYVGHLLGRNLEAIERFVGDYTIFALVATALVSVGITLALIIKGRNARKEQMKHETHSHRGGVQ